MAILAAFLLTVTTLLVSDVPLASADPDNNRPFVTYNMQGSNSGMRWTSEVGPLAQLFPVVALQEAGSGPPPVPYNANDSVSIPIPGVPPHPGMPRGVSRSSWRYGGSIYTVYFLETHVIRNPDTGALTWGGHRVNLAVVTRGHADEVRVVENPAFNPTNANDYRSRRALGIRIGTTVYYNIHGRGADIPQLITAIRNNVRQGEDYVIVGDWNVNILNLSSQQARLALGLRDNERLVRSGRATHQSGGELDYAVMGTGIPQMQATVPEGRGADHYYVQFTPQGNQVTPPVLTQAHTYSVGMTNVSTGSALDIPNDSSGRVITHPQRFNAQQRFQIDTTQAHWYMFKHGGSGDWGDSAMLAGGAGLCPGVIPGVPVFLAMQPCTLITAQWTPEDPRAVSDREGLLPIEPGPVRWRNAFLPQVCLTAMGPQAPAAAVTCNDTDSQLWWTSARHVHPKDWETVHKGARVRAYNGSYLDAQGGSRDDLTNVIIHPRKDVDNQRWDIEFQTPGDNLARVRGVPSGKCVDVRNSDTAGPGASSVIYTCDDNGSKNDNTGHEWLMEGTGSSNAVRFRNEATHLCLAAPQSDKGQVTVDKCAADPRQVWNIEP